MVVGITGGIGSGKTSFSKRLMEAGYPVYNTDIEARRLQNTDKEVQKRIIALLGENAYNGDVLNRQFVASVVFDNAGLLKKLNEIVHPAVRSDFRRWCSKLAPDSIKFLECAILFEGGFQAYTEKVIVITADIETRIERVMTRDGINRNQVLARIQHQTSTDDMLKYADIVVDTTQNDVSTLDIQSIITRLQKTDE